MQDANLQLLYIILNFANRECYCIAIAETKKEQSVSFVKLCCVAINHAAVSTVNRQQNHCREEGLSDLSLTTVVNPLGADSNTVTVYFIYKGFQVHSKMSSVNSTEYI